jgi:hypothetical protein
MKKLFLLAIFLPFCLFLNAKPVHPDFTVSAEVEKSAQVDLPRTFVRNYINDLGIYPRYFPDILSVTKNNDTESVWVYTVDAPLAPTLYFTFTLEQKTSTLDSMVLESKTPKPDYLYCQAVFDSLGESSTSVTLTFKLSMTREKASEIHFMAGILGENFISARMKDKLEGDMETFIENAVNDMHRKFKKSH